MLPTFPVFCPAPWTSGPQRLAGLGAPGTVVPWHHAAPLQSWWRREVGESQTPLTFSVLSAPEPLTYMGVVNGQTLSKIQEQWEGITI